MRSSKYFLVVLALSATLAAAQETAPAAGQKPQVRINYLNVCTPSAEEQKEMAAALARIPTKPGFALDFEVSRGRSTFPDAPVASYVRVRRDFSADSPFLTAQYTMSVDTEHIVETVVFRLREAKDVLSVSIEDGVSAATPAQVLATDTPATRLRIERLGKSSLALARCQGADQSAYEPLFRNASEVLTRYRGALNVRRILPGDLARLGSGVAPEKSPGSKKKSGGAGAAKPEAKPDTKPPGK